MSKMSQLYAELSEQASELGFESISEAEERGYGVDWENGKLLDPETAAHEALICNRNNLVKSLEHYSRYSYEMCCASDIKDMAYLMQRTAKFLKENVK